MKSKFLSKILAAVLSVGVLATCAITASAAPAVEYDTVRQEGNKVIYSGMGGTKNIVGNNIDNLPTGSKFTFVLTAGKDVNDTTTTSPMPAGAVGGEIEKEYGYDGDKVSFPFTFGDITYDHVGAYEYTITEKDTDIEGMEYDKSTYTVTVYVENDPDPEHDGQYIIQYVTAFSDKGTTETTDDEKTNTGNPDTLIETTEFTNDYSKEDKIESFTFGKEVVGAQANKSDKFTFSVKLGKFTANSTYYTITRGNGRVEDPEYVQNGAFMIYNVGDGDRITFYNVPVGTKYSIEEVIDEENNKYTQIWDADIQGEVAKADENSVKNAKIEDTVVADNAPEHILANYKQFNPPTGFGTNALPFVLLLACAGLGFVGFAAAKKRKANNI